MTSTSSSGVALTREFLLNSGFSDLIRRVAIGMPVQDDAERAASIAATLAQRGTPEGDVWVFAYGSLIWNPTFHFRERRVARVVGWQRAFCLAAKGGRGTPEHPAPLLGLIEGGACAGVAFRIAAAEVASELDLLWRREMITGSYIPRWVALDGGPEQAITFVINPASPAYAPPIAEAETARRIATARGPMGTAAEYFLRTREGLCAEGIADPLLERLAPLVGAAQGAGEGAGEGG